MNALQSVSVTRVTAASVQFLALQPTIAFPDVTVASHVHVPIESVDLAFVHTYYVLYVVQAPLTTQPAPEYVHVLEYSAHPSSLVIELGKSGQVASVQALLFHTHTPNPVDVFAFKQTLYPLAVKLLHADGTSLHYDAHAHIFALLPFTRATHVL
jgi:hypothetical protein